MYRGIVINCSISPYLCNLHAFLSSYLHYLEVNMYKIEFIPTGHIFELPDLTAEELKEKFPEDYKILEKNGKKFKDKIKKKAVVNNGSIYDLVVEKG